MSQVILCTTRRARKPYFITHVGLNIYSAEELCYYMEHNLYLLDETILNRDLLAWMKDELHLRRLVQKLYPQLHEEINLASFILPIFREISYFNHEEMKGINDKLERMKQQAPLIGRKQKGDALMHHGKYLMAIQVYQKILGELDDVNIGSQIIGSIYHNLGCAFAYLFEMQEAENMFREAYKRLHTVQALRSLLFATYLAEGKESYEKLCTSMRVDPETRRNMDERILAAIQTELPRDVEKELDQWIEDYHLSTGL